MLKKLYNITAIAGILSMFIFWGVFLLKFIKSFAICTLLSGCGITSLRDFIHKRGPSPRFIPTTNIAFKPHIQSFENHYNLSIRVPIYFKKLKVGRAGECWSWSDGYREIVMDPDYWKKASESGREQLIFHELGHCVFNLDHNDNHSINIASPFSCPESIMRSWAFNSHELTNCYNFQKQYYIDNLR